MDGMAEALSGALPSAYEQVTRTRVEALEKKFDEHQADQAEVMREVRDKLEALNSELLRRLPLWATIVLSLCTAVIGALLTVVFGG